MAPLTWRNVATPHFGDSVAALALSGRSLDRGFSALSEGLGKFSEWQTDQNDRTVLGNAQQIQDPTAYRDALQNGTVLGGIAPTGVSARTLGLLDARRGALVATDQAGYEANRTQNTNRIMDNAGPAVAAFAEAAASGDAGRAQAARAGLAPALQGLPADQILRLHAQGSSLESSAVGTQGGRIQNARGSHELSLSQASEADRQAAASVVQQATNEDWSDADATQRLLRAGLSPRAQAVAIEALRGRFPNIMPNANTQAGSPGAGGTPGSAPAARPASGGGSTPAGPALAGAAAPTGAAANNPHDAYYGSGAYGRPSRPVSQMNIGEVLDFGRNTLIPATRGRVGAGPDRGTSATGAFQITGETLETYGPRVLGADWRTQQYTPENQRRLAEAIYNDRRSGNLVGTWAALEGTNVPGTNIPANTPGAFRNIPFSSVAAHITQRETGGGGGSSAEDIRTSIANATESTTQAREASERIAARRGEIGAQNPLARRHLELAVSEDDVATVARNLREGVAAVAATDRRPGTAAVAPAFPGLSQAEIETQLRRLRGRNPGMSFAQAGHILRNSGQEESGNRLNPLNWGTSDNYTGINQNAADVLAETLRRGKTADQNREDADLGRQSAGLDSARTRVEAIQGELQRLQAIRQSNPTMYERAAPAVLERLREAETALRTAARRQEDSEGANPTYFNERRAAQRAGTTVEAQQAIAAAAREAEARANPAPVGSSFGWGVLERGAQGAAQIGQAIRERLPAISEALAGATALRTAPEGNRRTTAAVADAATPAVAPSTPIPVPTPPGEPPLTVQDLPALPTEYLIRMQLELRNQRLEVGDLPPTPVEAQIQAEIRRRSGQEDPGSDPIDSFMQEMARRNANVGRTPAPRGPVFETLAARP